MDRVGPGGLFVYAAVLLTMLAVLAGLRGRSRSAIEVKATRCPSTPMITASLDAMIRTQDEPQRVRIYRCVPGDRLLCDSFDLQLSAVELNGLAGLSPVDYLEDRRHRRYAHKLAPMADELVR